MRSADYLGQRLRIAAIVPCHNEEMTIDKVVTDLFDSVPGIVVYVYDNCSTDGTAARARLAGAIVREERLKGKGNVVRRAFADIDADVYVLVDGDDTYDVTATPDLIATLLEGPYDHVLGVRSPQHDEAYRNGHQTGNRVLNAVVGRVFGTDVGDMLSGFRVFSRRFVKSFPAFSSGFEIETELTVHALTTRVPQASVQIGFRERPAGSESKLHTVRDGLRILGLIVGLARLERPLPVFAAEGAVAAGAGAALAFVFGPAALWVAATMLLLFSGVGTVLDHMRKSRHTVARLAYLGLAPLDASLLLEMDGELATLPDTLLAESA